MFWVCFGLFLQFWAVFAIFAIFAIWAVVYKEKYSNNCGAKKLHRAFLGPFYSKKARFSITAKHKLTNLSVKEAF